MREMPPVFNQILLNRYQVDTSTVMLEYERTDSAVVGKLKEQYIKKM